MQADSGNLWGVWDLWLLPECDNTCALAQKDRLLASSLWPSISLLILSCRQTGEDQGGDFPPREVDAGLGGVGGRMVNV